MDLFVRAAYGGVLADREVRWAAPIPAVSSADRVLPLRRGKGKHLPARCAVGAGAKGRKEDVMKTFIQSAARREIGLPFSGR